MMKFIVGLMVGAFLYGQTGELHSPVIKGRADAHLATNTLPHRTGTGSPDARDNCTVVGETYYRTDAVAGSNTFACTTIGTPGTWTLQGGGASAFIQLTDNSTVASSTVVTHAAGSIRNSIGGKYTTDATVYTITHTGGTDNCNFRVYWDVSVDPPVKTFMRETGCGSGNWTLSSGSFVVGSAFPVGTSLPLSTIPVTAGVLGTPVLYRTGDTASAPPCGANLTPNGVVCDAAAPSGGSTMFSFTPVGSPIVTTDAAETTILSKSITGGTLTTTGCIEFDWSTQITAQPSGGNMTYILHFGTYSIQLISTAALGVFKASGRICATGTNTQQLDVSPLCYGCGDGVFPATWTNFDTVQATNLTETVSGTLTLAIKAVQAQPGSDEITPRYLIVRKLQQ